jgi:hypothetical protein
MFDALFWWGFHGNAFKQLFIYFQKIRIFLVFVDLLGVLVFSPFDSNVIGMWEILFKLIFHMMELDNFIGWWFKTTYFIGSINPFEFDKMLVVISK